MLILNCSNRDRGHKRGSKINIEIHVYREFFKNILLKVYDATICNITLQASSNNIDCKLYKLWAPSGVQILTQKYIRKIFKNWYRIIQGICCSGERCRPLASCLYFFNKLWKTYSLFLCIIKHFPINAVTSY